MQLEFTLTGNPVAFLQTQNKGLLVTFLFETTS